MSAGYHFLVVDDDAESRATVVEYLKSIGHDRVTECSDGGEAIRALDRDPTLNFIISDWDMPLMNGLTLLQRVKAHPGRANLPFLIMTSPISQEAEKVMLAAENLVDGYLIKPFRINLLQEKIERILETPIRGPQKQVLVVDDDEEARAMVIEYLKQMGFKDVVGLADGKAALEHLQRDPAKVGLIVSDWDMPELNGIDLLKALKGTPSYEEIPFLMITSQSSIESMKVVQAARASVDDYLLKPFSLGDIRKRVESLIERTRTRNEVQEVVREAIESVDRRFYTRAQRLFEKALQLDPENDIALRHMGDLLQKVKGVEAALPFYKKAVERSPYNPKGYLKLASAYEHLGWTDKAIALLQAGNRQISFSAELHFQLGKLYDKKGMLGQARSEFERTLEIQLDHQEARLMIEMLSKRGT